MKKQIIFFSAVIILISCMHGRRLVATEPNPQKTFLSADPRLKDFEVRKWEVEKMRGRRGEGLCPADTAAVKMSAKDLYSLMNNTAPSETDSFVFYFVRYKSDEDQGRYRKKDSKANWKKIKGSSSLLVAFAGKEKEKTSMFYDLGLLCPPPPGCGCEAEQ